ncbi:MAG: efflux transporter outer membrane subunit [Gammaproteobacteria bacterium]|nr:efflux transporter outer membrane subunit [Gammaproteobacteria bacterium]
MNSRLPLLLLTVLANAGCTVGPEPRVPSPESLGVPAQFHASSVPTNTTQAAVADWWDTFDDPVLSRLVEQALAANTNIDAAGARVRQARAALEGTRAGWWPTLDFGASASRLMGVGSKARVPDRTTYDAGFDARYELDLFGGQRRAVQASMADLATVEANLHSTQLTVAAEVALNYVDARLAQRQLAIARANLSAQDETLQIVQWRVQAGLVGTLDLEQARQLRAQTAATVPLREQALSSALNRLSVLTGKAPGDVDAMFQPATPIPMAFAAGIAVPAAMLRRRPDVTAAERTLIAETARIGVREADLYPALGLAGSLSGNSSNWGDLTSAAFGSLAAGLTAPIFQGGRLRAAVEQQRAAAIQSLAVYRDTVLVALEEAENALVAISVTEQRERELAVAEEAARNAAALARSQYQAGVIDFSSLLDAERSLLATETSRATAHADRAAATVQLYKALGGGWENAPPPRSLTSTFP